jgi:alkanesulfonate monooxygenase SsuD/methylene tetrahydromethanopterin reductase-like flavin-dependent oxidoreductase (luciferase family)
LLRRLWTEPVVTFDGRDEHVTAAGIAPLPVQRPIPVWVGGASEPAYRRIGRIADGWFPQVPPNDKLDAAMAVIAQAARDAGRDPATIGMDGRVNWAGDVDRAVEHVGRWRAAGATHLSVNTMNVGVGGVDAHLAVLERVAEAIDLG